MDKFEFPRFFSFLPFTVNWLAIDFHCFPPFSCIGKVIQKIISDKASGILIVPNWYNQYWYPSSTDLLAESAFFIQPSEDQLYLPNQHDTIHPLSLEI